MQQATYTRTKNKDIWISANFADRKCQLAESEINQTLSTQTVLINNCSKW